MDPVAAANIRVLPRNRGMKTRAAIAFAPGEPLVIETVDVEGPKPGEVLVEAASTSTPRARRLRARSGSPISSIRAPSRAISSPISSS